MVKAHCISKVGPKVAHFISKGEAEVRPSNRKFTIHQSKILVANGAVLWENSNTTNSETCGRRTLSA